MLTGHRQEIFRSTLLIYGGAMALCFALWLLQGVVPFVANHFSALVAAIFLYWPTWLIRRRDESFLAYGLSTHPLMRGLLFYIAVSAAIFPIFTVAFFVFYKSVCLTMARTIALPLMYRQLCPSFVGAFRAVRLRLPPQFFLRVINQFFVIALPEEYFFRGYLQTRLDRVWEPQRRFLGGSIGVSLVVSSLLFALGHVIIGFNPLRMAVFFPALVFGWLRSATGSILASVLFHGSCNLVSDLLHRGFFSR